MKYERNNNKIWNRRIPTLLGLLLLLFGTVVSASILQNNTNLFGKAATGKEPQNIRITNISDTSFIVTYTTTDSVPGTISYGQAESEKKIGLDDRDQDTGTPKGYETHHITIKGLNPETQYEFTIVSSDTIYQKNNQPFSVTTAPTLDEGLSDEKSLAGKVLLADGSPGSEILVYASTEDGQILSTVTKQDGSYTLPIHTMRTKDLTAYAEFTDETSINLLYRSSLAASEVETLVTQINPVPQITLSKNYDFTQAEIPISDNQTASESAQTEKFPLDATDLTEQTQNRGEVKEKEPAILTPKQNEGFSDQQPEFTGTALPNETIEITIQSDPIKTEVIADKNGNWSFRPDKPLPPGQHTITIVSKDALGLTKRLTRSFTVFAEGSQFTEPSVSPTKKPSPTPTTKASPIPTLIPTVSPTITSTPTRAVIVTPVVSAHPTPVPSVPPTGNESLVVSGIAALGVTIIGLLLFFLTRGGAL